MSAAYMLCDSCNAKIKLDSDEDFFLEPPKVNEPIVVCESCYLKIERGESID